MALVTLQDVALAGAWMRSQIYYSHARKQPQLDSQTPSAQSSVSSAGETRLIQRSAPAIVA